MSEVEYKRSYEYLAVYNGLHSAAEDLSDKRNYAVALNDANAEPMWQLPGSIQAKGILVNNPNVWQTAKVQTGGIAPAIISTLEPEIIKVGTRLRALSDGTLCIGSGIFVAVSDGASGESISVEIHGSGTEAQAQINSNTQSLIALANEIGIDPLLDEYGQPLLTEAASLLLAE